MNPWYHPAKLIPLLAGLLGAIVVAQWLIRTRPPINVPARVPGTDTAGKTNLPLTGPAKLTGTLTKSGAVPASLPGSWPRFRGPNGDDISPGPAPLSESWSPSGPPRLWSVDLGEGYAGAAVLNSRVYVLDYDQLKNRDTLRCLSLADGQEIWSRSYPVKVKRNHGMSRTVPAVTSKYVVTIGPKCQVVCLDSITGDFRWGIDMVNEFHARVPPWYAGQCPLIDGDRAILAPGGVSMMIAVDCAKGQVLWKTPNPHLWNMTHSSIVPVTFEGKKMYVYCASGGVVGVSADDGKLLWETDAWKVNIATVPSPVVVGDGKILLTGGYDAGSMLLQLEDDSGKIVPRVEWRLTPDLLGSDQQTPIFYQGHIYAVIPDGELACLDLAGHSLWTSGSGGRFGLGPYLIAGGMIYLVNDTGTLTLARATPEKYEPLAQAKVLTGHDSWGPLAMAGKRLIARDLTRMVCLDVGK